MASEVPALAAKAVLVPSGELPVEKVKVQGYDFNKGVDYHELLSTFKTSGFQATNFGLAVDEINRMVRICGTENNYVYFTSKNLTLYIMVRLSRDCFLPWSFGCCISFSSTNYAITLCRQTNYLTIIELTMWPSACPCVWQSTPRKADVTVTKLACYVRVRILMNQ